MPVPPPPPPPGMPSLAPPPSKSVDPQGRNMLLESIRQGAKLKKVGNVNDRSSPLVDANKRTGGGGGVNNNSVGSISPSKGVGGRSNGLTAPPGLAGLFAGGMPKLKSVSGSSGVVTNREKSSPSRIGNSVGESGSLSYNKPSPPQPPPSNMKPIISHSNQNSSDGGSDRTDSSNRSSTGNNSNNRASYGKPMLAPKPPANGPPKRPDPPPKLYIPPNQNRSAIGSSPSSPSSAGSGNVNRAQSMRVPKSLSPPGSASSIEYRTVGRNSGARVAASISNNQPPPPPRFITNGNNHPNSARRNSPQLHHDNEKIVVNKARPTAKPPPPPNKAPPTAPPPPPPPTSSIPSSTVPPLPPHRTGPVPPPPPPPPVLLNKVNGNSAINPSVPPPPPTRNSSMRSLHNTTNSSINNGVDLESRFGHLFHKMDQLPEPEPFKGMLKTYPSKAQSSKRLPAPQPPASTQIQLGTKMWVNNSSNC